MWLANRQPLDVSHDKLAVLQHDLLSAKVANQQKAKIRSRSVLQTTSGPLTAAGPQKKKEDKCNVRCTRYENLAT